MYGDDYQAQKIRTWVYAGCVPTHDDQPKEIVL